VDILVSGEISFGAVFVFWVLWDIPKYFLKNFMVKLDSIYADFYGVFKKRGNFLIDNFEELFDLWGTSWIWNGPEIKCE
jgi:hypothetical protein